MVKDKKTKKLMILAGELGEQYKQHLFSYNLGDYYGFDLLKHKSGIYVNSESREDDRYPSSPNAMQLLTITSATPSYTSIQDTLDNEYVQITLPAGLSGGYHVISLFTEDQVKKIMQSNSIGIEDEAGTITKLDIKFINETEIPTTHLTQNGLTIGVPKFSIVVEEFASVDYTKKYRAVLYNRINVATANIRPGMIIDAGGDDIKIYATVSGA
jgi:hypothetical protein